MRARHWRCPGTSLGRRLRALGSAATLGLCLVALAGCGILPIGGRVTAAAGVTPGRVVDPGARPDPATCERRIRADIPGAVAVRGVLASSDFGPLPIATDEATARQAAADPASDIATFGIPVTADELAASLASGIEIDSMQPVFARMWAARDRYGERWLDDRGALVVAVMSGDAATVLRCFEPADRQVRYVEAGWSSATLTALQDRITGDWLSGALKQAGIDVRMTGQTVHDDVMVVEVTVHGLTPAIADELRRRYGDPVVVVEGEGAMPA